MIDKPSPWPQLSKAERNPKRLEHVLQIMFDVERCRDPEGNPGATTELVWRVWGKQVPAFGKWLADELYRNPKLFDLPAPEGLADLTPPDTILRDSRYLRKGDAKRGLEPFFEKPRHKKEETITKEVTLDNY